jgi:hypothetical protein
MILNTKKIYIISVIFILASYHYFIHNGLEKKLSQTYFEYNEIKRPLELCDKEINSSKLSCTGMPSGHAETFTVFCVLLYLYNFIPIWLTIIIIMIVDFQRIISNKHTLSQVIVGSLLGLLYALIYKFFNLSIYGFLFIFSIGFILTVLTIFKIHQEFHLIGLIKK